MDPVSNPQKTQVLGIEIDSLTTGQFLDRLEEFIAQRSPHQVAYVNAHSINKSFSDRGYRAILRTSDLVYADGMGVVLASRLFGGGLPERVNAGDFLDEFCGLCARKAYRLYFLGGEPGVADEAVRRLRERHPALPVVGVHHGYFTEVESPAIVEDIRQKAPDVLLVGMGQPKQEKWIRQHLDSLEVPVAWGVGNLFSYFAGRVARAPVWMRQGGLEWLHRLIVEPRRLWKRYLVGNLVFAFRAAFLVLMDILTGVLAWLVAWLIWTRAEWLPYRADVPNDLREYIAPMLAIIPAWAAISAYIGLYRRRRGQTGIDEINNILKASLFFLGVGSSLGFLIKEWSIARYVVLLSCPINTAFMLVTRFAFRGVETRLLKAGVGRVRTLIVGTGDLATQVRQRIEAQPDFNHDILGFVDGDRKIGSRFAGKTILGRLEELGSLVVKHQVDEVVIAAPELAHKQILNLMASCPRESCRFRVVTDMFGVISGEAQLDQIDEIPIIEMGSGRFGPVQSCIKRTMDIVFVLLAAPIALPLGVFIALAIKISSPGPIFFVHERVGRDGKVFNLYKFRTMRTDVNPYEEAPTNYTDARIAGAVGRKLRRFSLDEMPQLWNVLRGDMSLVGPRPEMPFIVAQYEDWQRRRLNVKPGITGLWQVIGRKDLPLHENLEYDFYYIQNQSIWLDLSILLKTVPVVIGGYGAY